MANWFVSINGDQKGPYPTEQLRQLVADGLIPRDAYVWREGMAQWLPLSQVRISDDVAPAAASPAQPQANYSQSYQTSPMSSQTQASYSDATMGTTGGYVSPGYFSFSGRISRQTFWMRYVLLPLVVMIIYGTLFGVFGGSAMSSISEDGEFRVSPIIYVLGAIGVVLYILLLISALAGQVKRLHDRGRSGWFVLLSLVPIANIWILIEVCFLKGTTGPNEFGADPLG